MERRQRGKAAMKKPMVKAQARSPRSKRKMVRTAGLVLLVVGGVTVAGCSSGSQPGSTGTSSSSSLEVQSLNRELPASIRSESAISDYINIPYQPMEMYNSNNQPTGVDVDLMNDMGAVLGVKIKFTNVEFPDLLPSLQAGRANVVMSGVSDTSSSRDVYTFIDYFRTGSQMETSRADMQKYHIKGLQSMCGLTVESGEGDAFPPQIRLLSQKYCGSPNAIKQLSVLSLAESEVNITDGRAQAMMRAGPESVSYNVNSQPGGAAHGEWVSAGPVYYPTDFGMIFVKGSPLVKPFLGALKVLFQDGKYKQVLAKYHVASDALSTPTVNQAPQLPA
jgi:polar amino acid transport system substrate-binding protein